MKIVAQVRFRFLFLATSLILGIGHVFAQQTAPASADSTSADKNLLRYGKFSGHARVYAMATNNRDNLTDYFGIAAGAGLGYRSPTFLGFDAGFSGFMIFNLASSDFSVRDSATGSPNRYEIGLFDIENPKSDDNLDRTEELFLRWRKGETFSILYGRFLPKTPLINPQDGRMSPTFAQGLWIEAGPKEKWRVQAGWLNGFSPRSTVRWYSTAESIGVYPSGLNPDGSKSDYKGNLATQGVFIGAVEGRIGKYLRGQVWNYFTENIFNTVWAELSAEYQLPLGITAYSGVQAMRQDALADGGNADPAKAYFEKNGRTEMFGFRLGARTETRNINVNYTRITTSGRYLLPREWGRDPFYTFLPRERNEGLGDVHAFSLNAEATENNWRFAIGAGYYDLPDALDARLNKYALPSYMQTNLMVRHRFHKTLEGLEGMFLVVHKFGVGETYGKPGLEFNKVDMTLVNLVFDYYF